MHFDLFKHPVVYEFPHRLTDVASWHGLIPFGFALISMLKPKVLVELGTHKGDSYCAFCQAVDRLGLETRCYALDTWQGDIHAGTYEETVFEELREYHDRLYGRFSRLIQTSFDEGLSFFDDGSIDLLHIDGLHTYEAVKHDFATWLPKMSENGVVLFHDTNVRERDFGVWKLWEEVSPLYPSKELKFSHGLGILAVGAGINPELQNLLTMDGEEWRKIENLFFSLGIRVAMTGQIRALKATLEQATQEITSLRNAIHERDASLREAKVAYEHQIHELTKELEQERQRSHEVEHDLKSLINSRSWRMTGPLRKLSSFARTIKP